MDNDSKKTGGREKDFDTPPALGAETEQPEAANPDEKKRAFVSKGEHIHKWVTYLGIDWIFNAFTGVGFSYFAKYHPVGQNYWSGPITDFFMKKLTFIKGAEQRKKSAVYGNDFLSIVAGGMFTLPPLLLLENRKIKLRIIKFLDRHIYGQGKVDNDPKFQEAYREIQSAPKKKFWRGMAARLTALAPLLAIRIIPVTQKISDKVWFDHIGKASGFVASKMGFSTKSFKTDGVEKWEFIHRNIATDFGLGVPYAMLHAFFYNLFSAIGKKNKNTSQEATKPPVQAKTVPDIKESIPESDEKLSPKYVTRETDRRNTVPASHPAAVSI